MSIYGGKIMFDITTSETGNQYNISIPEIVSLTDELQQIAKEIFVSRAALEFSLYRLYRILETGIWKETYTYEDFSEYIQETFNVSMMTLASRKRSYRALAWMGYTAEESIRMMIDKPHLYTKAIQNLVLFNDTTSDKPVLKIAVDDEEAPVQIARDIIESITDMTVSDAQKYIRENYTAEPTVTINIEGGAIVVSYTLFAPDVDGEVQISEQDKIVFHPNKTVPNSVLSEIKSRIRRV